MVNVDANRGFQVIDLEYGYDDYGAPSPQCLGITDFPMVQSIFCWLICCNYS